MTKRLMVMLLALLCVVSFLTVTNTAYAAEADESVETEPVETEPVETEPVETEPVETEPVETEPVETEPVETEPVETEPVETEPVETEPVETEPVQTESFVAKTPARSAAAASAQSGFVQNSDGTWSYYVNGSKVTSTVIYSGGKYYGFNSSGKMYDNTSFNLYDSSAGRYVYYRAKSGGALYVNEWYQSGSRYFYYGAGGKAPSGLATVDGIQYYFDFDGEMLRSSSWTINGVAYIASSTGRLTAISGSGWAQVDGYYYYAANGELYKSGVYKIGGSYYGFNSSGRMYDDTSFSIYDYDEGRWVYYRAKSGGALYVNEWVQPYEYYADYYYYGAGGKAPSGLATVDGVQYYFYSDGQIMCNSSTTVNGVTYIAASNGQLTAMTGNGWKEVDGNYYYVANGELYRSGVYKIGGSYYGFNSSGRMYDDTSFDLYDSNEGRWVYYRAKSGGALYVNEWVQPYEYSDDYYYYGAEGKAPSGLATVAGVQYYFYSYGQMMCDGATTVNGVTYIAASNGQVTAMTGNGWKEVDGNYYYVANGELYRSGVYKIGGSYYGFNSSGRMYDDTSFDLYDSNEGRWVYYRAKSGGALYVNEWVQLYENNDDYYYYGAGGKAPSGLATVAGVQYYFYSNGHMMCDSVAIVNGVTYVANSNGRLTAMTGNGWKEVDGNYYYVANGELYRDGVYQIGGSYYGFDWNGRMYDDTEFGFWDNEEDRSIYCRAKSGGALYVNEWYQSGSIYFYYGAGGKAPSGLTTVGGVKYCFYNDGEMMTSVLRTYDGAVYRIDANGVATKCSDGWLKHPRYDAWLYVQNGELFHDGLLTVGGKTYVFSDDELVEDGVAYLNGSYYASDSKGVLIAKTGWQAVGGRYVYVESSNGKLATGWKLDGGKWFYLNPRMIHNTIFLDEDGTYYTVSSSGVCTAVRSNGFHDLIYGDRIYIENGKLLTSAWKQINGSWYYFDSDGYMAEGMRTIDGDRYFFDANGKMLTGWIYSGSYTYYAASSGKLLTGLQTVDGIEYVFDTYGEMLHGQTYTQDGKCYAIGVNGAVLGEVSSKGWNLFDGKYYYIRNGKLVTSQVTEIDGEIYGFNYNGVMYTNTNYNDYFFGSDGKAVSGWHNYNGAWYYANPNTHQLYTYGKYTIDGQTYIFSSCLRTGTFLYDGEVVTTSSSGAVISSQKPSDGWSYVNGSALYYKNGKAYTGWVGKYYVKDGYMQRNTVISEDGKHYYLDNHGEYVKNQWYEDEYGDYTLARADGSLYYNEWYKSGSTWYYFSDVWMARDGIYTIDGVEHQFDENGKWLGEVSTRSSSSDGWKQIGGEYYYYHAGQAVTGQYLIDGQWYYFDYNGEMVRDTILYCDYNNYYFGSNGARAEYTGWKQIHGNWVYFNDNHTLRTGWIQEGTKSYYVSWSYYIDDDGYEHGEPTMTTGYKVINGQLYYFNSNGVCQGTRSVKNGWYQAGKEKYYFVNGELASGYRQINGTGYYFYNGCMMTDAFCSVNGCTLYFGTDGKQVTTKGWHKTEGGWIYIGEYGEVYNGVRQIGGKIYYFYNYYWEG